MEHNHTNPDRPWRLPSVVWIVAVGLLIALLAILFFNVPVGTVVTWGIFVALMFGSHFLHGGHGNHDSGYGQQSNPSSDGSDQVYAAQAIKADQTNHRHGCH